MIAWCRRIILSFFFVHCKRNLWSAFSVKSPDGRSVCRHATRNGELRQTGSKCYGGLSGVLFWRCGLLIGSLGRTKCAKCTRDHVHIHIHQLQLMPTSRSRIVLIVSSRNVLSRVCHYFNHTHIHTHKHSHSHNTPFASFQNIVSSSHLLFEHIF